MVLTIKSITRTRILETFKGKSLENAQIQMKLSMDKFKLIPEVNVTIKKLSAPLNRTLMENVDPKRITSCCLSDKGKEKQLTYVLNKDPFIMDVLSPKSKKLVGDLVNDRKTILVEFSSPNIAKPFHVGHFRSTIIGNFISNLYIHLNQNVKRLNYMGDWGTQFGILNVGVDLAKLSDEDVKRDPIKSLYNAYVLANQLSETDPSIKEKAKEIFSKLESGQFGAIDRWKLYKNYTIEELNRVYNRLGVTFDHYFWESDYGRKDIQAVLQLLNDKGVLHDADDGRKVVNVGEKVVPIVKSDGTTLYLTRDVAAFMDRYEKFKFDKLLYVVDHSQKNHFAALFSVAQQLDLPYAGNGAHVRFGRILGMSTRKGTAIFLQDILDEAKTIMRQKQEQTETTKIDLSKTDDETSDILGISAVIVNDLKQKRSKDYEFNWDNALQVTGDTGIKLQYTHCRLCSLEKMVNVEEAIECIPDLLSHCEAVILVYEIARFEDVLEKTEATLEACYLVNYLFSLCNAISRALKTLPVKNEPSRIIQSQRMLLFNTARRKLKQGMEILGLKPLNEM